jgi:hypothetical protein
MNWTRDRPTKTGWYWWRDPEYRENLPEVCKVYRDRFEAILRITWNDSSGADYPVTDYDGEWAGPLEPPA